jgi:plasmid stabilization system protein ParE
MAYDIEFEPESDKDLEEAIDFLGAGTQAARNFAEAIDSVIGRLLRFPESAPRGRRRTRVAYVPKTRYQIVYEFDNGVLRILGFVHTSRPPRRRRPGG